MSSSVADLLKIGIPSLLGLVTSYLTYHLGKRSKRDDIEMKKRYELAERISIVFQTIEEHYVVMEKSYEANFGHVSLQGAANSVARFRALYEDETDAMRVLSEKRAELRELVKSSRLYLDGDLLDLIEQYVALGDFAYMTDGGLFSDTYVEEFFRNLRDPDRRMNRHNRYSWVKSGLRKLVN